MSGPAYPARQAHRREAHRREAPRREEATPYRWPTLGLKPPRPVTILATAVGVSVVLAALSTPLAISAWRETTLAASMSAMMTVACKAKDVRPWECTCALASIIGASEAGPGHAWWDVRKECRQEAKLNWGSSGPVEIRPSAMQLGVE